MPTLRITTYFPNSSGTDLRLRIDIDQHTVTMHQFQHQVVHSGGWNPDWQMFFHTADISGVDPTVQDIWDYAHYLMEKNGFSDSPTHHWGDRPGNLGDHML